MHMLRKLVISYLVSLHSLSTLYVYNVVKVGFPYTFLVASIFSLILLLLSSHAYIKFVIEGGRAEMRNHVFLFGMIILPITLFYYLPIFYYNQLIDLLNKVFPSISLYLLWASYNPLYIIFIVPQFILSTISSLFVYFYIHKKFNLLK